MGGSRVRRGKRGMGPLLMETRPNPLAAVLNILLGIGSILGAGMAVIARFFRIVRHTVPGQATSGTSVPLLLLLAVVFLLGGIGFGLLAVVQITSYFRVYSRGLVWRRYGKKRIILWPEVHHFGRGDSTAPTLNVWSMLLHSGERINFHSGLYRQAEFEETMELIAELAAETRKQFG